jgi:hypothetical protein
VDAPAKVVPLCSTVELSTVARANVAANMVVIARNEFGERFIRDCIRTSLDSLKTVLEAFEKSLGTALQFSYVQ